MSENQRLVGGRYQLGELIGRGGMADVYQGTDTRLGRVVAIKLLKSDLANDPSFENRFRQEAQSSARMTHPTIVRVYDAGEDETVDGYGNVVKRPYIVMEYVRGTVLRDLMYNRRLTLEEGIDYAEGVLTALEISHKAGIVHRDIKSANIMITETGQVKVMDFGIARIVAEGTATQAHTQGIVGTAQYFSPEQARGETVDFRSDLYSTGVLLYEMLAGQPPFRGETAVSVAYQHVSEAVTAPSVHNGMIPASLDEVVMRALAKNKSDRFQSAEEFRDHLLAAVGVAKENAVTTNSVPLQIIEPGGLDDFDALLRGANEPLSAAAETVVSPEPVIAPEIIEEVAAQAPNEVQAPTTSENAFDNLFESVLEAPVAEAPVNMPPVTAPPVGTTPAASSEPTHPKTTVFENPFAEIGVEFDQPTHEPLLSKRGKEISAARPSTNILVSVITALVIVVGGLGIWFLANGVNFKIDINTGSLGTKVANVVGEGYDQAEAALVEQKLVVHKVLQASDDVDAGLVVSTDPPAGTVVNDNMVVTVYVSSGPAQTAVPALTTKTEKAAVALLEKYGFTVGLITPAPSATVKKGYVISSDPAAGTMLASGSTVNLTVSNGKVVMPDVTNKQVSEAKSILQAPELALSVQVTTQDSCSGALGTLVVAQSVAAGDEIPQNTPVILYVECVVQ